MQTADVQFDLLKHVFEQVLSVFVFKSVVAEVQTHAKSDQVDVGLLDRLRFRDYLQSQFSSEVVEDNADAA